MAAFQALRTAILFAAAAQLFAVLAGQACAAVVSEPGILAEVAELYNNETVMIARFRNMVDSGQRQGPEVHFGANDLGCPQNRVQDDFSIGATKLYWAKDPESNFLNITISRKEDVSFLEIMPTDGANAVLRTLRYPPSGTLSGEIAMRNPPTGGLPGCDPCTNCMQYSLGIDDINCVKVHIAASGNVGSRVALEDIKLNGVKMGEMSAEYGRFGDWVLLPYRDADSDGYSDGCEFDLSSGDIGLTARVSLSPPPTLGDEYVEANKIEVRFSHCPAGPYSGQSCSESADCDDSDPSAHPGAQETCGDGIDQDCDGADSPCKAVAEAPENQSVAPPPTPKPAGVQGIDFIPYAILAILVIGAIVYLRYRNG